MMRTTTFARFGAVISKNRRFIPMLFPAALALAAYAVGAVFYQGMREPQVMLNLFRTSPFLLISAIGMTFVIITGGIDLSVSGVIALTTVASAALLRTGDYSPWTVMLLMLVMGSALGAIMGGFITYLKVQPFIATLAGMWFARGMCYVISDDAIPINNRIYRILSQTKILIPGLADPLAQTGPYISISVVLMILVLGVAIYLAHYTHFGRTLYAIGGSEPSARLMGLPVNRSKILVYTLSGFCSALAGITYSIYVASGHGSYAKTFEMTVIAAVVMGGTMMTGGVGYVFGTLFGVLITGITQTLIQFNGQLSSWWTSIVVGALTLMFIGVQSLLTARNRRRAARTGAVPAGGARAVSPRTGPGWLPRMRRPTGAWQVLYFCGGAVAVIALAFLAVNGLQNRAGGPVSNTPTSGSAGCALKPFRPDQAAAMMLDGAVITYERNGGSGCIDELIGIFTDGRIVVDDGSSSTEKHVTPSEVEQLLAGIDARGWFTAEMYSTSHVPCGQCFSYAIRVSYHDQQKTVEAVDGGTDAPADYWQVVSLINGVIP